MALKYLDNTTKWSSPFSNISEHEGEISSDSTKLISIINNEPSLISSSGLLSTAEKAKFTTITTGAATSVVLANGTVVDIATLLKNNIATIRSALGVVTKTQDGLMPKLPDNPNA